MLYVETRIMTPKVPISEKYLEICCGLLVIVILVADSVKFSVMEY